MKRAFFLLLATLALNAQPSVTLDPTQRFQTVQGFGVNFNGTYFREAQKPALDMLVDDLGATVFRLDPYGLTNWETLNDNRDPQGHQLGILQRPLLDAGLRGVLGGGPIPER